MAVDYLDGRPLRLLYTALYDGEPVEPFELTARGYQRQPVRRWVGGVDNGMLVFVNAESIQFRIDDPVTITHAALTDRDGTIVHTLPLREGLVLGGHASPGWAPGALMVYAVEVSR